MPHNLHPHLRRGPRLLDVGIDLSGAATDVALFGLWAWAGPKATAGNAGGQCPGVLVGRRPSNAALAGMNSMLNKKAMI